MTPEQKYKVLRLRDEGLTYQEIGDRIGVSDTAVRRVIVKIEVDSIDDRYGYYAEKRIALRKLREKVRFMKKVSLGETKPCEHCRWRKNKEPVPVCVVCFREVIHRV